MPTLQDVAKRAGVSTATVSKVLSNTPYFSKATQKKVMEAVDAVGYIPNLAARALTTGKTQIIGVVFPYVYEAIFEDMFVMSILKGIEFACNEQSHNILLSTPRILEDQIDPHFLTTIQSGYVDGMICLDSVPDISFAQLAQERDIPNVVIGYKDAPYSVRCDEVIGSRQLTEHVLNLGHREIGIISVPPKMNMGIDNRMIGMRQAFEQVGCEISHFPIRYGDYSIQSGYDAMQELLVVQPNLTAIISLNDRMAIGAIQCLTQAGKSIPDDVTVVGYDNIELSQMMTPSLTTVDQHPIEQGRIAAEMLFDLLNDNSPQSVVLDTTLIIRESTVQLKR